MKIPQEAEKSLESTLFIHLAQITSAEFMGTQGGIKNSSILSVQIMWDTSKLGYNTKI